MSRENVEWLRFEETIDVAHVILAMPDQQQREQKARRREFEKLMISNFVFCSSAKNEAIKSSMILCVMELALLDAQAGFSVI